MERTFISLNTPNVFTIWIAALLGYVLFSMIWIAVKKWSPAIGGG